MSRDQAIRDIAYAIWESEGCPEGQQDEHWKRAEAMLETQSEEVAPVKKTDEKSQDV